MDFKGLSNSVTNTHPLLPSMGTTRQKSSCRNRLQNGPRSLSRAKAGTHSAFGEGSHTRAHTAKHGAFRTGALLLPSERSTRFGNPAWPDVRTANFAAFGSWPGVLLKNAESLRDSDALMRVAVPRRRGPAGLRRPTPPAERTVLAPISPRVQLCLRRPAFPLSAFIPGA